MRDRLMKLLCGVECDGEETFGNCPQRRDGQCGTVQKLEMCQIGAIADHLLANGVIVPPYKCGTAVYVLRSQTSNGENLYMREERIEQYRASNTGTFMTFESGRVSVRNDEWSRCVFATLEEAERALKENTMPRYIDADALYRDTEKMIAESHQDRMAVVDDEFLDMINDAYVDEDVVEVVRCKDCDVPHNKWTGCPNLNGMIPPPDFYCAKGKRKQKTDDVPDIGVGDKPSCKVCEKITEANKDIFWTFTRTHQFEHKEEFVQVPARFCPACGREIEKLREITLEEYT